MNDTPTSSRFWHWVPLVVLCLALMISAIDTTLLNVSVAAIIQDLHTTITEFQWVIAAYSLTLAALTVTGGRLGDLYGRKKMFMVGAIIFGIGSYIASASHTIPNLIWGESIIEGIGAALMLPATSSLIVAHYKGRDRALAFGAWGAIASLAVAIGPVLGGFLTTHYSWRWGFRINPVIAVLLLIGSQYLHDGHLASERPKLDWLGILLSGVGLFFLLFGIIEAENYGIIRAKQDFFLLGHNLTFAGLSITVPTVLLGLGVLGLFLLYEVWLDKKGQMPLVSPHLFENKEFTSGALTYGIFALGQIGLTFSVAVFLESVRGLDAFHTSMIYIPMALGLIIFSPLGGYISGMIAPKRLIQIGFCVDLIAMALIYGQLSSGTTITDLIPGMFILGCGLGLIISQLTNVTLSAVKIEEAGEASGINNTSRLIGQSIGAAVVGAVLVSVTATRFVQSTIADPLIPNTIRPAIITTAERESGALQFALPHFSDVTEQSITNELQTIRQESLVAGNRVSFLYMIGFTLFALVTTGFLTNKKRLDEGESPPSSRSH